MLEKNAIVNKPQEKSSQEDEERREKRLKRFEQDNRPPTSDISVSWFKNSKQ